MCFVEPILASRVRPGNGCSLMSETISVTEYTVLLGRKPDKYGAKATDVNGIRFASQAEAERNGELVLLLRAGEAAEMGDDFAHLHNGLVTRGWRRRDCYGVRTISPI